MNMGRATSEVICPRYGKLCSGASFDCYSKCRRWASERTELLRQDRRQMREWREAKQNEFSEQMQDWRGGEVPCPRCHALVPEREVQAHYSWHWNNDRELST